MGFVVRNPYTGDVVEEVESTRLEDALRDVDELHAARREPADLPPHRRAEILADLADRIGRAREPLARRITETVGKTIRESRVEVDRAASTILASAEESRRLDGEVLESDAWPPARGKLGIVRWRPIGVVLAITPFNFPLNIAAHKLGPAFAAGNPTVLKPSPQGFPVARDLVRLGREAGISETALRLVLPETGGMEALVGHPSVRCVNFTGSERVGREIARAAGMTKLVLELGGNDPLIVMADADVEAAVETAVEQRFGNAGQRCTAVKKALVHAEVYERFLELLLERTARLRVGDPAREETDVGPVVSDAAATEAMDVVGEAVGAGARLRAGHVREGNLVWPTVLLDVPPSTRLAREELLGPVLPVWRFGRLSEAIDLVNESRYGLQAGVFTTDLQVVRRLHESLEVGTLVVNSGPGFRAEHFPFGGVKGSGLGQEGVRYAIREMSVRRTLVW